MRRTFAALMILPILAVSATPAMGQSPLEEKDKAVGAFEIYLDRLSSSDAVKASGAEDAIPNPPGGDVDLKAVRRVYGAASAPQDVASIESRQGTDPLDMNFFIRIQFKSADAAQKAYQGMAEKGRAETINGKEYYRPPEDEATPSNMLLHMVSPDTIEVGTDGFVLHDSRHVFSDNLLAAWKKMPVAAIRIAADLDGVRHLIDQGMQMAQANGGVPPAAMPAVAMVENTGAIRLALDFSSDSLLWLTFTGKDDAATGTIKATFDGFLAMGKGMGQQMAPSIPGQNLQKVAGEMLAALQTTQDGNDVNLVLPRPEGFEAAIGEIVPLVMGAMMGGMKGGPGGPAGEDPFGGGAGEDPFGGNADPFGAPPADAAPGADADPFGN